LSEFNLKDTYLSCRNKECENHSPYPFSRFIINSKNNFICPVDDCITDVICPVCKKTFYFNISKNINIIPIFGGKFSGKTTLFSSMLSHFEKKIENNDFTILNTEGRNYLKKISCQTNTVTFLPGETNKLSSPMLWLLNNRCTLMYDMPGEWVSPGTILSIMPLLNNARTFVVLVDPYTISYINKYLPPVKLQTNKKITGTVDIVLNIIESYGNSSHSLEILGKKDVVFVVTKGDVLKALSYFHPNEQLRKKSDDIFKYYFNHTNEHDKTVLYQEDNKDIKEWLEIIGILPFIKNAASRFNKIYFQLISSLGTNPMFYNSDGNFKAFTIKEPSPVGFNYFEKLCSKPNTIENVKI
jgi:hypothetical protein